jgi:hypothetical protein
MTPEIVADLHPPRLPADFIAPGWPDVLAAFGLGLLLAALAAAIAAPLLRPRPRRESVAARLAVAAALPPDARQIAQLRLIAETGAALPPELSAALYTRTPPEPEALDAVIRRRRRA